MTGSSRSLCTRDRRWRTLQGRAAHRSKRLTPRSFARRIKSTAFFCLQSASLRRYHRRAWVVTCSTSDLLKTSSSSCWTRTRCSRVHYWAAWRHHQGLDLTARTWWFRQRWETSTSNCTSRSARKLLRISWRTRKTGTTTTSSSTELSKALWTRLGARKVMAPAESQFGEESFRMSFTPNCNTMNLLRLVWLTLALILMARSSLSLSLSVLGSIISILYLEELCKEQKLFLRLTTSIVINMINL